MRPLVSGLMKAGRREKEEREGDVMAHVQVLQEVRFASFGASDVEGTTLSRYIFFSNSIAFVHPSPFSFPLPAPLTARPWNPSGTYWGPRCRRWST